MYPSSYYPQQVPQQDRIPTFVVFITKPNSLTTVQQYNTYQAAAWESFTESYNTVHVLHKFYMFDIICKSKSKNTKSPE